MCKKLKYFFERVNIQKLRMSSEHKDKPAVAVPTGSSSSQKSSCKTTVNSVAL